MFGGGGIDRLYGGVGDDILDAGAPGAGSGFQYLYGRGGDDTYNVASDHGRIYIHSHAEQVDTGDHDLLHFTDLTPGEIALSIYDYTATPYTNEGRALQFLWSDGEVRIAQGATEIEAVEFADGSRYALPSIGHAMTREGVATGRLGGAGDETMRGSEEAEFLSGGGGIDKIYGGGGDDVLSAGTADGNTSTFQYLYGQNGDDTYLYAREDGRIYLHSHAERADTGERDRMRFVDLTLEDLRIGTVDYRGGASAQEGVALSLTWHGDDSTWGEVRLAEMGREIETFEFADGVTLTPDDLAAMV